MAGSSGWTTNPAPVVGCNNEQKPLWNKYPKLLLDNEPKLMYTWIIGHSTHGESVQKVFLANDAVSLKIVNYLDFIIHKLPPDNPSS